MERNTKLQVLSVLDQVIGHCATMAQTHVQPERDQALRLLHSLGAHRAQLAAFADDDPPDSAFRQDMIGPRSFGTHAAGLIEISRRINDLHDIEHFSQGVAHLIHMNLKT